MFAVEPALRGGLPRSTRTSRRTPWQVYRNEALPPTMC